MTIERDDEEKRSESRPQTAPSSEDSELSGERRSIGAEFREYLMENKKWWLIPIILVVLFFLAILILGGSPAATFIYTVF